MLLALTLSGCATEAQRESNSMQQIINETKSSNDSCKQQMNQNPSVQIIFEKVVVQAMGCLLYTSPSPRDRTRSRMPSSA